jgi:hypothetical protein
VAALLDCSHQHVIFLPIMHQCSEESIGLPYPLVINLIMDGEDILVDFAEDKELDVGIAAHCRRKVLFYRLEKRKKMYLRHSLRLKW